MSRYILTKRIYSTLVGRGFHLVCKRCDCPLQVDDEIESKHSKYLRWECINCGRISQRQAKRGYIRGIWTLVCRICSGRVYIIGRKFYHSHCYDEMHFGGKKSAH